MAKEMTPTANAVFYIVIGIILLAIYIMFSAALFCQLSGIPLETVMPWTAYQYYVYYGDYQEVKKNLVISHGVMAIITGGFAVMLLIPKRKSLYGNAKWAKEGDLKNADPPLRGKKGILVGKFKGKYMVQTGQQFVMMAAPTRSMKGVGVVIPNCLNWDESLVVTDIKLENYAITSGYRREMGQEVFVFNPSPKNYKGHRWNCLGYINPDKFMRIDDIQKIAEFLVPTPRGTDPMWSSSARELFMGLVLYILDTKGIPKTLGECYRQLMTEKDSSEHFKEILSDRAGELDPACIRCISAFSNLPSKQREGVKSTLTSALNLWANPIIDAATSENDFDFRDLRRKPMTIYIGIPPNNLERLSSLLNLFIQQLVDLNTTYLPAAEDKYSTLLLLDEFPALGNVKTIIKGVSYMAGYNLRLLTIIQSPAQLREIYGNDAAENYVENHATRIVYAPKNAKLATEIADDIGYITVKSESVSKPRDMGKGMGNRTLSEAKRHLILPQEVKEIGKKREIVISENCRPVMGEKIIYYNDEYFTNRCIPKANREKAKKAKSQEVFIGLCKKPAQLPKLTIRKYGVRGMKDRIFDLDFDSVEIPGNSNEKITEDQVDAIADDFMKMIAEGEA